MRLRALLNVHSFFSFGAGASSPRRLVEQAAALGYEYVALTDLSGVYGAVELQQAARQHGIKAITGATLQLSHEGKTYPVVLLAGSRQGYTVLNSLIDLAHQSPEKTVTLSQLEAHTTDLHLLTGGRWGFPSQLLGQRKVKEATYLLEALKHAFKDRLWLQVFYDAYPWDMRRARVLRAFGKEHGVPVVAAPEIRYATPDLYSLYDTLMCARLSIHLMTPHRDRPLNDVQCLPHPDLLPLKFEDAIFNANRLAEELAFDLLPDRLLPPPAVVPDGYDADSYLESLCREALLETYRGPDFSLAKDRLEHELYTLKSLGFADFFLVCKEVLDFCRSRGILAYGRGSAAGSIICYLLGITQADPVENDLLFERFLHTGKRAMPDIDIDISSSRRDEVFSWIEQRFPNSAMVANRVSYYLPSALQDVGRAVGLPPQVRTRLTHALGRDYRHLRPDRARDAQVVFDEVLGNAPVKEVLFTLLEKMEKGFVRHIAPHSGGWVLSRYPLNHYSPQERSTGGIRLIQFDKDDTEALGLMKLDLLGLRMLGVFERAREEIIRTEHTFVDFSGIPEDKKVWQTIGEGDTMTLFQIESPAQVRMSVQLKPENRLDLKDQVALVRPGPIQSDSVHPYVRRRKKLEDVSYPHPALEPILKRSYGVLLYQEQVMQIAHHFAGFSWEDADQFRKQVSSFEDEHEIKAERQKFIEGAARTVAATEAEAMAIFNLCANFRGYGFAESHAWAFGLHAYTSAWLRHHYPAEYLASVMSEQPGMYTAGTIRQEARLRGIGFARLDINVSSFHYFVERTHYGKRLRPPLSVVKGVSQEVAKAIVLERLQRGPYTSLRNLFERVRLDRDVLEALDRAGAFERLVDRREGLYQAGVLTHTAQPNQPSLFEEAIAAPPFPELSAMEKLRWDFSLKGYSHHAVHPVDLYRNQLLELGATPMAQLSKVTGHVRTAGLVVARQKPPTARGFAFWLIEDNQERAQVVIPPALWEAKREVLRDGRLILAEGLLEREGRAWTLRAEGVVQVV
jgi:error-prone DNA polymerase